MKKSVLAFFMAVTLTVSSVTPTVAATTIANAKASDKDVVYNDAAATRAAKKILDDTSSGVQYKATSGLKVSKDKKLSSDEGKSYKKGLAVMLQRTRANYLRVKDSDAVSVKTTGEGVLKLTTTADDERLVYILTRDNNYMFTLQSDYADEDGIVEAHISKGTNIIGVLVTNYQDTDEKDYYLTYDEAGGNATSATMASPSSVKATSTAKKKLKVTWTRVAGADGYDIQYSTSKNFKSAKTTSVARGTTVSKTISGLKSGKKYYVQVRAYKSVNGKKVYSGYKKASKAAKVK